VITPAKTSDTINDANLVWRRFCNVGSLVLTELVGRVIIRERVFPEIIYNAEGVDDFQPRVARVSALPCESDSFTRNPERLWNARWRTLTEFVVTPDSSTQGVALG
jgi:hypothetical protein